MISAEEAYRKSIDKIIEQTFKSIESSGLMFIYQDSIPPELEILLLNNGYRIIQETTFGEHNSIIQSKKISWEHACPNESDLSLKEKDEAPTCNVIEINNFKKSLGIDYQQ